MNKKRVLFIASTGGHLNELMQLEPMFNKYDYSKGKSLSLYIHLPNICSVA